MPDKIRLYFASALFSGRETYFNVHLASDLERTGRYSVFLPQRDGFEFTNLADSLIDVMNEHETDRAFKIIIYAWDIGKQLAECSVVVANLDEDLDPGVIVEQSYARIMKKLVVGFRTDVRTPYGGGELRGMHFFPAFQDNVLVRYDMPGRTCKNARIEMRGLAERIDKEIWERKNGLKRMIPKYALNIPEVRRIIEGADLLFKNIKDIHSRKGLINVTRRYKNNKDIFDLIFPELG